MKYLSNFKSFLILEEAELKYSQSLYNQILQLYNSAINEIDKLENFDDQTGKRIDKSEYVEKFYELIKSPTDDILYEKFTIQLGAAILQKGSEQNYEFADKFEQSVKESINQKKLNENLSSIKPYVGLKFKPFFEKTEKKIKFGSMTPLNHEGAFGERGCLVSYCIKLNVDDHEEIRTDIKNTIRHELQHLTQIINQLCLKVGEIVIKSGEIPKNFYNELVEYYNKSVKEAKFGVGKTKTGLRQGSEIINYDGETGKPSQLKKVLNLDISTKEGMDKAENLQYLLDDREYKPWITDKVNHYFETWKKAFKEKLSNWKIAYHFQINFGLKESLTDEQTKKIEQKKQINALAKKWNMTYIEAIKLIKSFNISEKANLITRYILEKDVEINQIKKYRKEVAKDINKLLVDKLKNYFESKNQ